MSFPPGVLSTWKPPPPSDFPYSWNFGIGNTWTDPNWAFDRGGYTFTPLAINDLACPTWGLGKSTSADGSVITTIGPPWLPLIAPPMELFSLDQTWASLCTGFIQDRLEVAGILLFDPPIALTRGLGLVPFVTPTSVPAPNNAHPTTVPEKQTAPSTTAAKPANSPTGSADPPARTADAGRDPIVPAPSATAVKSANSPTGSADPPSRTVDAGWDPIAPSSDAGDLATPANQADPSSPDNVNPASDSVDPQSGRDNSVTRKPDGTQTTSIDPKESSWSAPKQGESLQSPTPGLGALIYNAFDKSGPGTSEVANQKWVLTTDVQEISMGRDQILSIDPSGVKFQGKVYSIDGPGITLSNSAYTVVIQEKSEIHTVSVDQSLGDALPATPTTLTIAGQTIIPNPTGFILGSATLSPGGPAQTFDGTMVSLEQSGTLIIGSSTIPLLAPHTRLASLPTTNSPMTIESKSSHATVDGVTTSLSASGVTVDGSVVSLETGDSMLDNGTGRFVMMPTTGVLHASSGGLAVFENGQGRRGLELSLPLLLSVLGGTILIALTM